MNGEENSLLKTILDQIGATRDDIKKTSDEVRENRNEFNDVRVEFAETKADVKNLVGWVTDVTEKMNSWSEKGCPHGQSVNIRVENNEKNIDEVKKIANEARDGTISKKTTATWSSSFGALAGAFFGTLANIIANRFN